VTADKQGVKVFGLGALNKNEALNGGGALFVKNNPHLKVRVVHGTTLTAAAVLQKIPEVVAKIMSVIPVSVIPVSVFHDDCVSRRCDDVVVLTRAFNCTNRVPSRPSFSEPPPNWDGKLPSHSRHEFSPNLPRLFLLENLHLGKSKWCHVFHGCTNCSQCHLSVPRCSGSQVHSADTLGGALQQGCGGLPEGI
jgi:hypothetical protein